MLRERFGVSERKACSAIGQPRSTQRLPARVVPDEEQRLVEYLIAFSKRRPRWGWRRAAKQARRDGWDVNDKRVKRLWRLHGLRVPAKKRKQRLTGIGTHIAAMSPIRPNVLWALDFQFDTTVDGRTLKMLNVIDEFTSGWAIDVARDIDAAQLSPQQCQCLLTHRQLLAVADCASRKRRTWAPVVPTPRMHRSSIRDLLPTSALRLVRQVGADPGTCPLT